jgi:hypothetical protein
LLAAQLARIGSADAQSSTISPADATTIKLGTIKPGTNTSFGALKQIDAGVLNVGYAEAGPADGPAVILLHGWPYDIHSFVDVAPLLASAGYRVIVPHLRGHGTTRFLSSATFRNAQQSVVALDVIALMDALGIGKAILAGATARILTCSIRPGPTAEPCPICASLFLTLVCGRNQEAGRARSPCENSASPRPSRASTCA